MEARLAEIPSATGRPMRARTKGNWGVKGGVHRREPWTAAADSSPASGIEDPLGRTVRGIAAGPAEIASVTAAFPQAAGRGGEELLVVARVD